MKIQEINAMYHIEDAMFLTLDKLIAFYKSVDIPNQEGIRGVRLLYPIKREGMEHRAPVPLPRPEPPDPYNESLYYTAARDKNRLSEVRRTAESESSGSQHEEKEDGLCQCGLRVSQCSLPDDWSMHLCATNNELFFVSPDNKSWWELPDHIYNKLPPPKQQFIRQNRYSF